MKASKIIAAAAALVLTASAAGCGSSSGSSSDKDSSYTEKVEVANSDDIAPIAEDAEKEIEWFSYFDINPSRSSPEKRTDLALFEQKGGKINYTRTGSMKKYDDLAARLLADDPPDMFWYETGMTFPANCIKGMFQSVDPIVDFDSPTPRITFSIISIGSPTPIKYLTLSFGKYLHEYSTCSYCISFGSPTAVPPIE